MGMYVCTTIAIATLQPPYINVFYLLKIVTTNGLPIFIFYLSFKMVNKLGI